MYRKGFFIMDDMTNPVEGWTTGENWNGFATPLFEKEVADQIARLATWSAYIEEYDMYVYSDAHPLDANDNRHVRFAKGLDITTDGREVHVYPIGDSWTWREVEATTTSTTQGRERTFDITLPPGVELVKTDEMDDIGPTFDVTGAPEALIDELKHLGVYVYWFNRRRYAEFNRYTYDYETAIAAINEIYDMIT